MDRCSHVLVWRLSDHDVGRLKVEGGRGCRRRTKRRANDARCLCLGNTANVCDEGGRAGDVWTTDNRWCSKKSIGRVLFLLSGA
mmetsp:Transcript_5295/g.33266  ORF Transcript_5295/g.33266 Transcript_5295/m.33266 type:complete len:84 (+) Transcript_5295:1205-1456(+)